MQEQKQRARRDAEEHLRSILAAIKRVRNGTKHRLSDKEVLNGIYRISLSWGGPAVRIAGDLDEQGTPISADLQYQDWFTEWESLPLTPSQHEALLDYAALLLVRPSGVIIFSIYEAAVPLKEEKRCKNRNALEGTPRGTFGASSSP